jgi:hypothetical protein
MNNMEDRLKIKKLWHSLLPGDIICDSITSGENLTATVVAKKNEGCYSISVLGKSAKIKSVALGIFKWHHKTNLVISEKNVPVLFFNKPFGIKKTKDLMTDKDPSELISGGYQMTREEFKEILKKINGTYKKIKEKLEEKPSPSYFPLTNTIMNSIFGPGNYTKREYALIALIIHHYEKRVDSLIIEKEEVSEKLTYAKDGLLEIQQKYLKKLPPPKKK